MPPRRFAPECDEKGVPDAMAPRSERSQLKRPRVSLAVLVPMFLRTVLDRACPPRQASQPEGDSESKKPRRSSRLSQLGASAAVAPDKTPVSHAGHLPSPVTRGLSGDEEDDDVSELHSVREATATPPDHRPGQAPSKPRDDVYAQAHAFSSPPQDTQPFSQFVDPEAVSDEVEDEVKEGVWGYLFPLNTRYGGRCQVLKKRTSCPLPDIGSSSKTPIIRKGKSPALPEQEAFENNCGSKSSSGGYLIGRHAECGMPLHPVHPGRPNPVTCLSL